MNAWLCLATPGIVRSEVPTFGKDSPRHGPWVKGHFAVLLENKESKS
jgi:hypothetical protein